MLGGLDISKHDVNIELLEAAYKVFSLKGYEKTTVDNISKCAGYTKGAFYWYFESKEDLFIKLIEHRIKVQQEEFSRILDQNANLLNTVEQIYNQMFFLVEKDNWTPVFIEFLSHAARNQVIREKMASMYKNWRFFIKNVILGLQIKGSVSKSIDPYFTASLLIAIFDGINLQHLVDKAQINRDKIIEIMIKLLKK